MSHTMWRLAPAKINLYLGVHEGVDGDGYHRVDSIMAPVALCDLVRLELNDSGRTLVEFEGDDVAGIPANNTVVAAMRGMVAAFGRDAGMHVVVRKRIPAQSGLGGASSDAAVAMLALCDAWGIDASDERVAAVARSVGADVPFFLTMVPGLFVGRGDVLEREYPGVVGEDVVLVVPPSGVSTPAAYAEFDRITPERGELGPLDARLCDGDLAGALSLMSNNLEPVACNLVAGMRELLAWMSDADGVRRAMLTGSGSCVFAFVDGHGAAEALCQAARERGLWACATHVLTGEEIEGVLRPHGVDVTFLADAHDGR